MSRSLDSVLAPALQGAEPPAFPHEELSRRFAEDPELAARLLRDLAHFLSSCLDRTQHWQAAERVVPRDAEAHWDRLRESLEHMRDEVRRVDREGQKNDGVVPEPVKWEFVNGFMVFMELLEQTVGDGADLDPRLRQELGSRVQKEILPYLLMCDTGERIYTKPRGYAGDFLTIDMVYRNRPAGTGRLGPVLDSCLLECAAARAVRNRRTLLVEEIRRFREAVDDRPLRMTSLACGPAREVFDAFDEVEDRRALDATLVDFDLQALAFVSDIRDRRRLQGRIKLLNENLVDLATGRRRAEIEDQDLVYSIGLIDYFNDKVVLRLLNWIHGLLRPGGRVILGNFHPRNPNKAYMDHVVEWPLIHRSEADMDRLFQESAFGGPSTRIRFEEQGINLFAECVRG